MKQHDSAPRDGGAGQDPATGERLNSWKEIASYLGSGVRTAQRLAARGLPVHRHEALGTVYAYKSELHAWLKRLPAEEAGVLHRDYSTARRLERVTPGSHLSEARKRLTIEDLGWTEERAREVRSRLASFADDWDDPSMDVYDES